MNNTKANSIVYGQLTSEALKFEHRTERRFYLHYQKGGASRKFEGAWYTKIIGGPFPRTPRAYPPRDSLSSIFLNAASRLVVYSIYLSSVTKEIS